MRLAHGPKTSTNCSASTSTFRVQFDASSFKEAAVQPTSTCTVGEDVRSFATLMSESTVVHLSRSNARVSVASDFRNSTSQTRMKRNVTMLSDELSMPEEYQLLKLAKQNKLRARSRSY